MTKVYVVHEHEPSEGSTILYVGANENEAQAVRVLMGENNARKGLHYQDIDITELTLNEVPEERDITLKVSKRELDEILHLLDVAGNRKLSNHLSGGNES